MPACPITGNFVIIGVTETFMKSILRKLLNAEMFLKNMKIAKIQNYILLLRLLIVWKNSFNTPIPTFYDKHYLFVIPLLH